MTELQQFQIAEHLIAEVKQIRRLLGNYLSMAEVEPETFRARRHRMEEWLDMWVQEFADELGRLDAGRLDAWDDARSNFLEVKRLKELIAAGDTVAVPDLFSDGFDPHGDFVYLLWGADIDQPLYVGMSSNVLARLGAHLGDKKKAPKISTVTLVRCETRSAALVKEAHLIRAYRPPWNVRGNTDWDALVA